MATLQEIRDRIRQRTDNENSTFVTDAEVNALVNLSYKELYGVLVRYSLQRAESVQSITADGSSSYSLNGDFFSCIGVYRTDGDVKVRLERFNERFRPGSVTGTASSYRLIGMDIVLYPKPGSGTYEVVYIPTPGTLTADDDELDGVLGWEEYVVVDVAIKVLQKEEAETADLKQDKAALLLRIQDEAAAAEFTENWTVHDSRGVTRRGYIEGDYVGPRGLRGWR